MSVMNYKKLPQDLPKEEGLYIWKTKIGENEVLFPAVMRYRSILDDRILSPKFDYWTGYQIVIPDIPLEWSEYNGEFGYTEDQEIPPNLDRLKILKIVGKSLNACPFCKKEPNILYHYNADIPQRNSNFEINCCSWIKSQSFKDLDKLVEFWNGHIN